MISGEGFPRDVQELAKGLTIAQSWISGEWFPEGRAISHVTIHMAWQIYPSSKGLISVEGFPKCSLQKKQQGLGNPTDSPIPGFQSPNPDSALKTGPPLGS